MNAAHILCTIACRLAFAAFGHSICCGRIPDWTASIGQRWDTYDRAPWNLYNLLWMVQSGIRQTLSGTEGKL